MIAALILYGDDIGGLTIMMYKTKMLIRKLLPESILFLLKMVKRRIIFLKNYGFSDEEIIIKNYLDLLPINNSYCVDIAAQDGISGSQTLRLFKTGWQGIAFEVDAKMFSVLSSFYREFINVNLIRSRISPNNVSLFMKACSCPKDFSFLSLDIDSYDYFILDEILKEYRPSLICVEINEVIPPPIKFSVKYSLDILWEEGSHFQGQSISKCFELCLKYKYEIVELHYNNLFIVPCEINTIRSLSPKDAYDIGYKNRIDRKHKFPWNYDVDVLLTMSNEDANLFIREKFKKFDGKYILE